MVNVLSRISLLELKESHAELVKQFSPHLAPLQRLERAMEILTQDSRYSIDLVKSSPITFEVIGPNDTYTVLPGQQLCTCPDSQVLCKHRIAIKLILDTMKRMKAKGLFIQVKAKENESA